MHRWVGRVKLMEEPLCWRVGDSFINRDAQTRVIRYDLRVKEPFHSNGQWLLSLQNTIGPCEQLCLEHIPGHAAIVVMSVTRCCRPVRHSGLVKEELWA